MSILSKFDIPVSWQEITVEEYVELKLLDVNELGIIGLQLERFCILAGITNDDDRIEDIDIDELDEVYQTLYFLNTTPNPNPKEIVGDYRLININKISLGEFIDIDSFLQNNMYENLSKILSILYRKHKVDEWGEIQYEPYGFDLNLRKDNYDSLYIYDVYGAIEEFIKFRELIINTYTVIFSTDNNDDDLTDEEKEGLGEEEIEEINREIEKGKKKSQFAWPSLAYDLAGEDIIKMREIFKLPLTYVLNMIVMKITMNQQ
jgi:hypothetical protein